MVEKITPEDIEQVAGQEDENGVIQPSLDEILDPDPEQASDAEAAEIEDDDGALNEGIEDETADDEA